MEKRNINEFVAEEIRALLARRRMSASDLARKTGMTQRAISRRLTGEKVIDVDDLQSIAEALDVELAALLPRANEGRVLPTGARHSDEQGRGITIRKFGLTNRPGPNGHPKRTQPDPSTRRPARVRAAYAAS